MTRAKGMGLALLLGGAASGCARLPEGAQVFLEVIKSSGITLARVTIGWILLSVLSGLLLALAAYFLLRWIGGYRWDWRGARWFRLLTFLLMILLLPLFFGIVGFYEGLYRGAERVLTTGKLAEEVYPLVGRAGADALAVTYLLAQQASDRPSEITAIRLPEAELEAFRAGAWTLDLEGLAARLESVDKTLLGKASSLVQEQLEGRYPTFRSGLPATMLHLLLDGLAVNLAHSAIQDQAQQSSVFCRGVDLLAGMRRAAADAGNPRALTREELSRCLVRSLLVRPILGLARPIAYAHQMPFLVLAAAVILTPVIFFRTCHALHQWLRRRKQRREEENAAPRPPEGPTPAAIAEGSGEG